MSDIVTVLRASEIPQETTQERGQRELMEYILTPEGRRKLSDQSKRGFGTNLPGMQRRDYAAVGRKIFLVEPLPNGALPVYDRAEPAKDDEDDEG